MFAAQCSPYPRADSDATPEPSQLLVSRDDGTWKYSTTPPVGDAWLRSDFDDSRWQVLVGTTIAEPSEKDYAGKYRYEKLRKLGAQADSAFMKKLKASTCGRSSC